MWPLYGEVRGPHGGLAGFGSAPWCHFLPCEGSDRQAGVWGTGASWRLHFTVCSFLVNAPGAASRTRRARLSRGRGVGGAEGSRSPGSAQRAQATPLARPRVQWPTIAANLLFCDEIRTDQERGLAVTLEQWRIREGRGSGFNEG